MSKKGNVFGRASKALSSVGRRVLDPVGLGNIVEARAKGMRLKAEAKRAQRAEELEEARQVAAQSLAKQRALDALEVEAARRALDQGSATGPTPGSRFTGDVTGFSIGPDYRYRDPRRPNEVLVQRDGVLYYDSPPASSSAAAPAPPAREPPPAPVASEAPVSTAVSSREEPGPRVPARPRGFVVQDEDEGPPETASGDPVYQKPAPGGGLLPVALAVGYLLWRR